MTTVEEFARRLNTAGRDLERISDPILTEFGEVVSRQVSENAPKRTRRAPGASLTQLRPGVLELPAGSYLVGEVRGTSEKSPKSRTFLRDSLEETSGEFAAAVAKAALGVVSADVRIRYR